MNPPPHTSNPISASTSSRVVGISTPQRYISSGSAGPTVLLIIRTDKRSGETCQSPILEKYRAIQQGEVADPAGLTRDPNLYTAVFDSYRVRKVSRIGEMPFTPTVSGSRDDSYRNVTVWGQPGTSTLIGWRASSMGWNWSSVSRFFVSKRMMP